MRITSQIVWHNESHTCIAVWVNGAKAGELTVRTEDEAEPVLNLLSIDTDEEDDIPVSTDMDDGTVYMRSGDDYVPVGYATKPDELKKIYRGYAGDL